MQMWVVLQDSSNARQLHEDAVREMELRRRMRATAVPTGIDAVKRVLRSIDEPVSLFGERPVSLSIDHLHLLTQNLMMIICMRTWNKALNIITRILRSIDEQVTLSS